MAESSGSTRTSLPCAWRANAARYLPFIEREMAAVQSRELFLTPLQHVSSRYDKSRLVAGGLWLCL